MLAKDILIPLPFIHEDLLLGTIFSQSRHFSPQGTRPPFHRREDRLWFVSAMGHEESLQQEQHANGYSSLALSPVQLLTKAREMEPVPPDPTWAASRCMFQPPGFPSQHGLGGTFGDLLHGREAHSRQSILSSAVRSCHKMDASRAEIVLSLPLL